MEFGERFDAVVRLLSEMPNGPPSASERALLLVYEPELEHDFRKALDAFQQTLDVRDIPFLGLDLRTAPYQVLAERDLLDKSYHLEATRPKAFQTDLARRLQPPLVQRIADRSQELGRGVLILRHTAAVFPWVSFATVLKALPAGLPSHILVPFPGTDTGASLHFMGRRNGFDYLARRV